MTQPTIINLHPNGYTQGLHYYPFVVTLDRYVNVNLMVESVIQIKSWIMINADASEKTYMWKRLFEILLYILLNGKYLASIIDNAVITSEEITDANSYYKF